VSLVNITLITLQFLIFQVFGRLILNEGDASPSRSTDRGPNEDEMDGEIAERTRDIDLKEHMVWQSLLFQFFWVLFKYAQYIYYYEFV
jgi:hypothetical protein